MAALKRRINLRNEDAMKSKAGWFVGFAQWVSHVTGRPITFILAVAAIVIWGLTGPLFGYSDTWQLVINTATTIITFLMVFVIQNTQNRDTIGLHIKLDELIRVTEKARNVLLDLDHLDDAELERLKRDYARLAEEEIPSELAERRARSRGQKAKSKPEHS
jgi:low affinity Fe/Cu permease